MAKLIDVTISVFLVHAIEEPPFCRQLNGVLKTPPTHTHILCLFPCVTDPGQLGDLHDETHSLEGHPIPLLHCHG